MCSINPVFTWKYSQMTPESFYGEVNSKHYTCICRHLRTPRHIRRHLLAFWVPMMPILWTQFACLHPVRASHSSPGVVVKTGLSTMQIPCNSSIGPEAHPCCNSGVLTKESVRRWPRQHAQLRDLRFGRKISAIYLPVGQLYFPRQCFGY